MCIYFIANVILYLNLYDNNHTFCELFLKWFRNNRRKRIYEFYMANRAKGKQFTVQHFRTESIPERTIYNIIQHAENDSGDHERIQGSGRIAKKMNKKKIKRLKDMFDHREGCSQRKASKKFKRDVQG